MVGEGRGRGEGASGRNGRRAACGDNRRAEDQSGFAPSHHRLAANRASFRKTSGILEWFVGSIYPWTHRCGHLGVTGAPLGVMGGAPSDDPVVSPEAEAAAAALAASSRPATAAGVSASSTNKLLQKGQTSSATSKCLTRSTK